MKKTVLFLGCVWALVFGPVGPAGPMGAWILAAAEASRLAVPADEAGKLQPLVDLLAAHRRGESDRVWPGYDITATPTIIHFGGPRVYAFDLTTADPRWQRVQLGGETVLFSDQDHWNLTRHVFTSLPFEGTLAWVFSMQDPFADPYVFVHERFHRHQNEQFDGYEQRPFDYTAHLNADNYALALLENQVLLEYLQTGDMDRIRRYLAIHLARRKAMDTESYRFELRMQKIEGLATYVEFRTFEVFDFIRDQGTKDHWQAWLVRKFPVQGSSLMTLMHDRHYGVGVALGRALDALGVPGWKKAVDDYDASLVGMLLAVLNPSAADMRVWLESAKAAAGYDGLKQKAAAEVSAYQAQVDAMTALYQGVPGVEITYHVAQECTGGGSNARDMTYMPDGSIAMTRVTGRYACVNFQAVPLYFWKKSKAPPIRYHVTFKVEGATEVLLDGVATDWATLAGRDGERAFTTISWKSRDSHSEAVTPPGKLSVKGGKVTLSF